MLALYLLKRFSDMNCTCDFLFNFRYSALNYICRCDLNSVSFFHSKTVIVTKLKYFKQTIFRKSGFLHVL